MKLWLEADGEKVVLEGSLYKVMKRILELSGDGKELRLLSVHTNHWERRRWRKWYRRGQKDLKATAELFMEWVESSPYLIARYKRAVGS